jgi:sigma-B regulation protein RsbU (phosphoserine phosphatase)
MNRPAIETVSVQERLKVVVETMREMSRQTDPQAMVRAYVEKIRQIVPIDRGISLSRRDLKGPQFRITRSTTWKEAINPWKEKHRLPLLSGGLLAELIYGDEPRIIDDLMIEDDDPAADYLSGFGSLMAIPNYDGGEALNMTVFLREDRAAFEHDQLPDIVWRSNLFGRATNNLALKDELERAYRQLDRELQIVAEIQRALLPQKLPAIPNLDLAAFYQPSRRAGGDYYDFFPLPEGKWGIFIADVSGHGTPAAVLMAITHSIAHTHPGPPSPPGEMLTYLNHHLATRYTSLSETFVTAFYGIYDPATRTIDYASAGHNPPRIKRCQDGSLLSLDGTGGMPLGIYDEIRYEDTRERLVPGDQIVIYTDGITEMHNGRGDQFGMDRLDEVLSGCRWQARELLDAVLSAVDEFAAGQPADDGRVH